METDLSRPLSRFDYAAYFAEAISYDKYGSNFEAELNAGNSSDKSAYLPINWQRMNRLEKTFVPSTEVLQVLKGLQHQVNWLVISEHWCGDAAQSLPVLDAIAKASNGKIDFRLVYRDGNLRLMDHHLTGTSRSIPKLLQFDTHFHINGIWGPRPTIAQRLVMQLKGNPETAKNYQKELHSWYAQDKQKSIQVEVVKLIHRAGMFCVDCFR